VSASTSPHNGSGASELTDRSARPAHIRRVSTTRLAGLLAADLVRSLGRIALRPVRRDADHVAAEYDSGRWRRVLETRDWLAADSLESFVRGNDPRPLVGKIDGQVVELPAAEYYGQRVQLLQRLLREAAADADALTELGCGYGLNLFSLALCAGWRMLRGFDVSPNAVQAGREIARHFNLEQRVAFDILDLTQADHPNFPQVQGKTLFTFFCLEQLPHLIPCVLDNILAQRPSRVIHVESASELLKLHRPLDLVNYAYIHSVDYQSRLVFSVRELAAQGRLRLLECRRIDWAPTLHNDGSLLIWEPI
jgi:SAM-dependent methyltransferase